MRILVIEDEDRMRDLLRNGLREHGHTVVAAADAREGLSLARECSVDIVLLDLMLPGMDGWEAMRRLRESDCPASVIMLTACDAERDVIRGLETGADDYLTKPFSFLELLARIGNLQRARLIARNEMLTLDTLAFDSVRHVAYRSGRVLSLTRTEFAVLNCLFKSTGQPVSRSELVHSVWGYEQDISRGNLDSFISLLRKKIDLPGERRLVHTVKGMGYMLCLPDTSAPPACRALLQ
jgi:DNA-binding response OmpR family regulator